MQCMRKDCGAAASYMAGVEFHAEDGRKLARATLGLALCRAHFGELESAAAEILHGSAVAKAEEVVAREFNEPVDHERTALVRLQLSDPIVEVREQMSTGYVHRPFTALVPMGVELN